MGHFLAVTGFKSASVTDVTAAITDYLSSFGVPSESVPTGSPTVDRRDAGIYAPVNDWTVVLWPQYFNIHDFPLARAVASSRNWLVSTVHVYDSEYWEHFCCSGGSELHAFCSRPHFWRDDSPEDFQRMMAYASQPSRLASAVGVSPQVIQPYLADVDTLRDSDCKAHEDDQFVLSDIWVFVDFWRRLGIAYPAQPQNRAALLRLGLNAAKKLPVG